MFFGLILIAIGIIALLVKTGRSHGLHLELCLAGSH